MTLTLTLRSAPEARVWAPTLVPRRLQGLAASEVAALSVRCGRETLALGELFEVSGAADEQLVLSGDLHRVDGIGLGMDSGAVLVDGPCGHHVGARMVGGEIEVRGTAGDWAKSAGGVRMQSRARGAYLCPNNRRGAAQQASGRSGVVMQPPRQTAMTVLPAAW
jgi:formylmethanofuran dehydrogenase subunit C